MPLYDCYCDNCKTKVERVLPIDSNPPICAECSQPMRKGAGSFAFVRIDGQGYPSRKKWMDEWTPASPEFAIGSVHGEKY